MKKFLMFVLPLFLLSACFGDPEIQTITPPSEPNQAVEYCQNQGGIVEEVERDEGLQSTCFINDGLDGILCDLDLFYKKQCGHGDPALKDESVSLTVEINTDASQPIAMLVTAPNNESLAVISKTVEGVERIDQVVILTEEGRQAVVQVNEQGQPTQLNYEGGVAVFSNYESNRVDIAVTRADGSQETFENSPLSQASAWIPTAHAAEENIEPGTREENIESGYYPHTTTQIINTLGCAGGSAFTLITGGTAAPLLYLSCGAVITRGITGAFSLGPCQGDLVDCATEALTGAVKSGTGALVTFIEEEGPASLRSYPTLSGQLSNAVNQKPVTQASHTSHSSPTQTRWFYYFSQRYQFYRRL